MPRLFLPILAISILFNFIIARGLYRSGSRGLLALGIFVALLPIGYFKYSGFIVESLGLPFSTGFLEEPLGSLLPLGISFYTFQQITYLCDARARTVEPRDILEYSLYVLFFPQLIAGPIIHFSEIIPQFRQRVDQHRYLVEGLLYFAIGFVKKFFLADSFGDFADPIYGSDGDIDTQSALIATFAYTFQLYFDFSGYSDMAIGLARLFGIRIPWNFDSPYKARSISEFWRRWHMTLSRFLRDYVYISLGGSRGGEARRYRNLAMTMLIGGLWHGAAWTFVVWGGIHGLALAVNHAWRRYVGISLGRFGWLLTFVFVALLWVLFRAPDFETALEVYAGLLRWTPLQRDEFWWWFGVGLAVSLLLPNSHWWVSRLVALVRVGLHADVPALYRRVGIYSLLSGLALVSVTAAYYTLPFDQAVYRHIPVTTEEYGISHRTGDLRNNLWSKDIFARDEPRVAIVGSSFTAGLGRLAITSGDSDRVLAVSESLGFGGNGLLNGARVAASLSEAQQADVIVLGVSPLNFGRSLYDGAFAGQCLESVAPAIAPDRFEVLEVQR